VSAWLLMLPATGATSKKHAPAGGGDRSARRARYRFPRLHGVLLERPHRPRGPPMRRRRP